MSAMASQIIGVPIVCSTVCTGSDQRKHQSLASLAFVRESTAGRWVCLTKGHLMTSSCLPAPGHSQRSTDCHFCHAPSKSGMTFPLAAGQPRAVLRFCRCGEEQQHINDLVQDCSISSALAMEILQSCSKPSIFSHVSPSPQKGDTPSVATANLSALI